MLQRLSPFSIGNHSAAPMIAALVLTAIVPAAGVLWFMSVAMRNERLAAQEQLRDVYVTQLASVQRQLATFWSERQAALSALNGSPAPELFATGVRAKLADSLVIYDRSGRVAYPDTGHREAPPEERADWTAARDLEFQRRDYSGAAAAYARIAETAVAVHTKARALQAQAACLLKAGDAPAALACLLRVAGDPTLRNAVTAQGTLIAPNAQLLMLKLLGSSTAQAARPQGNDGSARPQILARLAARLNDYADPQLSAGQRRFLMQEVKALVPDDALFPTFAAEELAAEYLEHAATRPPETKLQRSSLPKVWHCTTATRGLVALYREATLKSELGAAVRALASGDAQISLLAPGDEPGGRLLAAPLDVGDFLPGWRLALGFKGADPLAAASARQTRFYLGIGFIVVVAIGLVAFLVARYVAAQMRLARLKNELVSTVSHELKTPLASMRALVDTLSAGRYRDERQLRDYLELIARENVRLSNLIDNFLTFSRLERGRQQFRFEPLEPARVVADAVEALQDKLHDAHCTFAQQVEPGLPRIRGDADALSTVLINLLDNAWKYTDADKRISARAYATHGHVCFEVADNGIGIAHSESKRIFDRFYQVDQSLTRQRAGCGLGLGIVHYIVRAHHGAVQLESEPGKGSTFRVTIPQATLSAELATPNAR